MMSMSIQIIAIALLGALNVAKLLYEAPGRNPCPCNT